MFMFVFVSCCGVVVCVRPTGTRCKVVLCFSEGKAFGKRTAFVMFVFRFLLWCGGLCVVHKHQM